MFDSQSAWPRGKMLGGCSSMNYVMWVRGNQQDFNKWNEMGCEGNIH
jgi:choline dehydrogenase-like flavoprotein